jgi:CRISPR-associated protein (TIGR02584 family)
VPDEIEIWTTTTGKNTFEEQVLSSNVWELLKAVLTKRKINITGKLALGEDSWKIFADTEKQRLGDLLTTSDNLAAADKMLAELRKYDEPSTQILLSIAGGRKTMGALALQCMSLVGREEDKVYHVLVNPPFDTGLTPPFFFPEKKGKKWQSRETRDKTTVTDKDAQINLFSVPYIRVRPLYEEKLKEKAVGFRYLCDRVQARIYREPEVVVDMSLTAAGGVISVDGVEIRLNTSMVLLWLLWKRGLYTRADLTNAILAIKSRVVADGWLGQFASGNLRKFEDNDDLIKALNDLKQKVVKVAGKEMAAYFPEHFAAPVKVLSNIRWINTKEAEEALKKMEKNSN